MDVGNFGSVDVKRVNCFPGRDVVPVAHNVFFRRTHSEGTTLNKNEAGARPLFFLTSYLVATHVLIVVVPTCYVGLLGFLAKDALYLSTGSDN